jgi:resuscitation-promoting factor RpfB
VGGFLLLQFGPMSTNDADAEDLPQLSAGVRGDDLTASRGGGRSGSFNLNGEAAAVAGGVASSVELNMLTTTTTAPPTTTTTVPPTTTTTAKPTTTTAKPKPPVTKPAESTPAKPVGNDVWSRLAQCESGMRNDLGAPYYGYFQFSAGTWRSVGGSGLPSDHSYDVQLEFANKLQAMSGWGQWPVCGQRALRG